MILRGNIVDVERGEVYAGEVVFEEGVIREIREVGGDFSRYLLPGLVDAHIHIESSMLTPSRFAEVAAAQGTVAVVADPHEIANVLGVAGVEYMIRDSQRVPLKFYFTAPSCVPATPFETSGAELGAAEVASLLSRDEVVALGEVMNYPGVVARDPGVMAKIRAAKRLGKPIDGHCPGLRGEALRSYVEAGISTEHECTSLEEAEEKSRLGMKIMLREGSSARNLKALARFRGEAFLVSDDLHAGDLLRGHVNYLLRRAVEEGIDELEAVRMASLNPARHYRLDVGMLHEGDPADIVVVEDLRSFSCIECYIDGTLVAAR
ncbi:amidohydrolase family protein, partial [Candidatus Pyrohabitans sp.]